MRRPGDTVRSSLMAGAAVGIAGLVAVALAWRSLAAEWRVAEQVPFLVSGGIGGLALLGFAAGIVIIQERRWTEARRRAEFDRVVEAVSELLAVTRAKKP